MGTSGSRPTTPGTGPIVPPWADKDGQGPGPTPPERRFQQFRTALSRYRSTGDDRYLRSAAGHYARNALGGDGGVTGARRMAPAAAAGAGLAHALAEVALGGTGATDLGFNLRALAGQDVESVIAAIVNALAPAGGPPDENEIREGMTEALAECLPDGDFDPASLDADMLGRLLQQYLTEEVFRRMLAESNGVLSASDDPLENLQAEQALRSMIEGQVDVTAGPVVHDLNLNLNRQRLEALIAGLIRQVWAEFESYEP